MKEMYNIRNEEKIFGKIPQSVYKHFSSRFLITECLNITRDVI